MSDCSNPITARPRRMLTLVTILLALFSPLSRATPTLAATITSASFSPNVVAPAVQTTLTVNTDNVTKCVVVTGTLSGLKSSSTGQTVWTFSTTAPSTPGLQTANIKAGNSLDSTHKTCTGNTFETHASYQVSSTPPATVATMPNSNPIPTWNTVAPLSIKLTATAYNGATVSDIFYKLDGATSYTDVNGTGLTLNSDGTKSAIVSILTSGRHTVYFHSKDSAGNTENPDKTAAVNIDAQGPGFTWAITNPVNPSGTDASGNSWYNTPVTVSASNVSDPTLADGSAGSGIATQPSSVMRGQNGANGTNLSASGTATDNAGNSTSHTISGINIDQAAPSISGAMTKADGSAYSLGAWANQSVTVAFNCSDTGGSGVAAGTNGCPSNQTFSTDGSAYSASGTVYDYAGNHSSVIVGDATNGYIKIDKTAPLTSATPSSSSTWNNSTVTVDLSASDGSGSGVANTYYAINGVQQTYSGANKPSFTNQGTYTLVWWSVDNAGNVEPHTGLDAAAHTAYVNIDETPPTISDVLQHPADRSLFPANILGWNNGDVLVHFTCGDTGGSNVASCGPDATVTTEGKGQVISGQAIDSAGNKSTVDNVTLNVDKTSPTISASATYPNGTVYTGDWTNQNITESFLCDDPVPSGLTASDVSGVVSCPTAQTFSIDGAGQGVSRTVSDNAGNTSNSAGVSNINIDTTAPDLNGTITGGTPGNNGWYTSDVTVSWSCHDALSGIDATQSSPAAPSGSTTGCPGDSTVTGEGDTLSATGSVTDNAGNLTSTTVQGIKIDRTAPVTIGSAPGIYDTGWYASAPTVTLNTGNDLSGVAATYYTVDGTQYTYNGPFTVSGGGSHTVVFWSADNAGNVEAHTGNAAGSHTLTIQIDNLPPAITGSAITANGNAYNLGTWTNQDVTVDFNCSDAQTGIVSGLAGCSLPTTLSIDGDNQSVTGSAMDQAGNTASATVGDATNGYIRIDTAKPQLTSTLPDPSGKGPTSDNVSWYNGDVAVQWNALDKLSGIDTLSLPTGYTTNSDGSYGFASTVGGEGRGLGLTAGAVSVNDVAGNTTSSDPVTGINIDRHGPTINKTVNGAQGNGGWYTGAVTLDFQCNDPALADGSAGSGVAACPTSKTLLSDGANQSVTSDAAIDYAGNTTSGLTVGGINIDGTAPQTSANNTCTKVDGYCKGTSAIVNLTANDATSGVTEIDYRVETGTGTTTCDTSASNTSYLWQKVSATNNVPINVTVPLSGSGTAEVDYYAVDAAGNKEATNCANLAYDNVAPAVTHTFSVKPNDAGWNNSNITLTWNAKDDDSGSGVSASTWSVTPLALLTSSLISTDNINWTATTALSSETASTMVNASVQDKAANTGTDSQEMKIDKTKPTISSNTSGTMGNNGWYVSSVAVSFTCSDPNAANGAVGSGIAPTACPDKYTFSQSGAGQSVSRTVNDIAGNTSVPATVSGINVDVEPPTITSVNVANGSYYYGSVPSATCSATDSFSGVQSCTVQVTTPTNAVGAFNYIATATDKAGNTSTQKGTFTVTYNVSKFLQPINDTAHTGAKMSIFKAGSTIPVKFRITDANGNPVPATAAPTFVNLGKVGTITGGVNSTGTTSGADTGLTYRYDPTGGQYIYNWKSPNDPNAVYRIGVSLNDGTTYTVDIGLK